MTRSLKSAGDANTGHIKSVKLYTLKYQLQKFWFWILKQEKHHYSRLTKDKVTLWGQLTVPICPSVSTETFHIQLKLSVFLEKQ